MVQFTELLPADLGGTNCRSFMVFEGTEIRGSLKTESQILFLSEIF